MRTKLDADRNEAWARAWPQRLRVLERDWLAHRRQVVNVEIDALAAAGDRAPPARIDAAAPAVGFALSGGGIRAATFSLGIFQALAKARLIRRIDYLSTVSGGGYFGGFLGRLYGRDYASPDTVERLLDPRRGSVPVALTAEGEDKDKDKPTVADVRPLRWLREHGRYMTPNGSGDMLSTAAIALRNFVALHTVIAVTALMVLLLLILPVLLVDRAPGLQAALRSLPSFGGWLFGGSLLTPSPWLDVLPLLVVLLIVPPGWAYWLIEPRSEKMRNPVVGLAALAGLAMLAWIGGILGAAAKAGQAPGWLNDLGLWIADAGISVALVNVGQLVIVIAVLTVIATYRARRAAKGDAALSSTEISAASLHALSLARAQVSAALSRGVSWVVVFAALGLFDTLGMSLYDASVRAGGIPGGWLAALGAAAGPLLLRGSSLGSRLGRLAGAGNAVRLPLDLLVSVLAMAAWLALFVILSAVVHGISYGFAVPSAEHGRLWLPTMIALAFVTAFAILMGTTWTFVNRSSHASLYSARLTRAYLGASNPARHARGDRPKIQEPLLEDDESIPEYIEHLRAHGGPMHFINVTINETASAEGRTVLRDRQGIGMAVGPFGLSAGVQHHARYRRHQMPQGQKPEWVARLTPIRRNRDSYSMFRSPKTPAAIPRAERMSLGQWIGVSGAAFSTGLGSRTSLGMSLLLGFANVRLGRWWNSGRRPQYRWPLSTVHRYFPVQAHLLNELTARFHGPQRGHWYLSDGGHFENMGAYELIRRRVPMIVVIDAEEDAQYTYEGFANLVRKARIDFGANIEPLDEAEITALVHPALHEVIGSLDQLRGHDRRLSERRAVLARVRYADTAANEPPGTLLYLKPTVCSGDPVDLREYHARNPPFPQQSTIDQFFDEAQWESYRKLGEVIGDRVFAAVETEPGDPRFVPSRLAPLPTLTVVKAWHAARAQPGRSAAAGVSAGSPDTSSSPGSPVGVP